MELGQGRPGRARAQDRHLLPVPKSQCWAGLHDLGGLCSLTLLIFAAAEAFWYLSKCPCLTKESQKILPGLFNKPKRFEKWERAKGEIEIGLLVLKEVLECHPAAFEPRGATEGPPQPPPPPLSQHPGEQSWSWAGFGLTIPSNPSHGSKPSTEPCVSTERGKASAHTRGAFGTQSLSLCSQKPS